MSKAKQKNRSSLKMKDQVKPIRTLLWTISCLIAIITGLFYLPLLHHQFVNWDDPIAILENPHIRSFNRSSLHWMFTTFHTGNWIPLTWLSLALDYAIGKFNPQIYHLHNLLLHTINTILVFFLSFKVLNLAVSTGNKLQNGMSLFAGEKWPGRLTPQMCAAFLTALLFGLHPIHVESVAWATERKDLLFTFFFFTSVIVYLNNISSSETKRWKWIACWGLFALSLLAKPMAITLPFVLLLLDVWPLNRFDTHFSKVIWEKIPFLILSLVITAITITSQSKAGAISSITEVPLDFRIMNAFHSLIFYIRKMVVPIDLVPFYPLNFQGQNAFSAANLMSVLFVSVISIICYHYRKTKPYLALAWLYYIITLFPVLGIIQVGSQAVADRYSYLPSWSFFLLFSAFLVSILFNHRLVLASLSTMIILTLGFATVKQLAIWKDSINLWKSVVKIYPDSSIVVHTNMGNAYKQFKMLDEALKEYKRALAIGQPHAYIYDGLGLVLLDKGFIDEAIEAFHQAIALNSHYASAHRNLWFAYEKKGEHELALSEILEAIKCDPEFAEAYNNLGISYGHKAKFVESIEAFKTALLLDPHNSKFLVNLATTYQRCGQLDQAIEWYKKGLQLNTNESVYYLNLANTYFLKGMFAEAIEILEPASHLQPPNADIFLKLALVYEKLGQMELAKQNYKKAMSLRETK